jgi:hypothetical protein
MVWSSWDFEQPKNVVSRSELDVASQVAIRAIRAVRAGESYDDLMRNAVVASWWGKYEQEERDRQAKLEAERQKNREIESPIFHRKNWNYWAL